MCTAIKKLCYRCTKTQFSCVFLLFLVHPLFSVFYLLQSAMSRTLLRIKLWLMFSPLLYLYARSSAKCISFLYFHQLNEKYDDYNKTVYFQLRKGKAYVFQWVYSTIDQNVT